jgi:hypothetical protein
MQAAPAVHLVVRRYAAWNAMLITFGLVAIAACGAWFVGRGDDLPAWCGGLMAFALVVALAGTCSSLRRHPVQLRWDSQGWYVTEPSRGAEEVGPLRLQLMLDAGDWLLLKFMPEVRPNPQSACWLPVQRRGIEEQWHSLRCAVYSPRPDLSRSLGGLDGPIRIE